MIKFLNPEYILALWFYYSQKSIGSYKEINDYRSSIQLKLSTYDYTTLFSDYYLDKCVNDYNDCFERIDDYIKLKVPIENLVSRFLAYLPNILLEKIYDT